MKGINDDLGMDRGGEDQRKNWRSRMGAMVRRYCGRGAVVLAVGLYSLAFWQFGNYSHSSGSINLIAGGALAQNVQPAPSVNGNTVCDFWAIRGGTMLTGCPVQVPSLTVLNNLTVNGNQNLVGGLTVNGITSLGGITANNGNITALNGTVFSSQGLVAKGVTVAGVGNTSISSNPNGYSVIDIGASGFALNSNNDLTNYLLVTISTSSVTAFGKPIMPGNSASTNANVQAPTGTASTTGVMMGLAGAITPATSGNVMLSCWSEIKSPTAQTGVQGQITVYMGTGSAPTNGAPLIGTAGAHNQVQFNGLAAATEIPLSTGYMFKGLTVGTAYWYDVALLSSNGADTVALGDLNCTAVEQY